jgi:hypothetical protein
LKTRRQLLGGVIALGLTLPAAAHHSGAMFNEDETVTLTGTVKAFQWTNPHCWIQVLAPGKNGDVEWSVEMGAPVELFRGGWRPATLKAGDRITVVIHPLRDNTVKGGLYVSATRADGNPITNPSKVATR